MQSEVVSTLFMEVSEKASTTPPNLVHKNQAAEAPRFDAEKFLHPNPEKSEAAHGEPVTHQKNKKF
jgi:hypothetical protein